jgi:hypothetical protein
MNILNENMNESEFEYTTIELIEVNKSISDFFQLFIHYVNEFDHKTRVVSEMEILISEPKIFGMIEGCLQGLYVRSENPFYRIGKPMIRIIEAGLATGTFHRQSFIKGVQEHKDELLASIEDLRTNSEYFDGTRKTPQKRLSDAENFIKMGYLYADTNQLLKSFILPILGPYVDVMEHEVILLKRGA